MAKVFISYSHDSPAHRELVLRFSERLRQDGHDTTLDQYINGSPAEGWPRWMLNQLDRAEFVLVVCSETYYRRFRGHEQPGIGRGVDWEGALITQELYGARSRNTRFVPVLFDAACEAYIPEPLRGVSHFVLDSEASYAALKDLLDGVAGVEPGPVGEPPVRQRRRAAPLVFGQAQPSAAAPPAPAHAAPRDDAAGFRLAPEDAPRTSRAPVVIAIEEAGDRLRDEELLKTERHLSLILDAATVAGLAAVSEALADPEAVDRATLFAEGRRAWALLAGSERRLGALAERLAASTEPQPVAWTGRATLLARLQAALLAACPGVDDEPGALLSVGFGAFYLSPVVVPGKERRLRRRPDGPVSVAVCPGGADARRVLAQAAGADVAVVVGADAAALRDLVAGSGSRGELRARVAVGLGVAAPDADLAEELLERIPCASFAPPALAGDGVAAALDQAFTARGAIQAAPCVVAAVRRAWLDHADAGRDEAAFVQGVLWPTWSWIGRPLFAEDFGQVLPAAAYPHLMDLRSVATRDWYFNRRKGIPRCYEADRMARAEAPEDRFHLYLSGAGGTGKSCFLHYLYSQYLRQPETLAVWYRVDAPSSEWPDVQGRILDELRAAARERLGARAVDLVPAHAVELRDALRAARDAIAEPDCPVGEVVIFIDQLERTFESGDEPDQERLERISEAVLDLLQAVGVGEGVRVFIASRKQYLPDFLRSSRAAAECGLQFNVLQTISDQTEQIGFIRHVLGWCRGEELLAPSVEFDPRAGRMLADRLNGHPLNMMLALIQVFSSGPQGEITEQLLERERPWEKLFHLDLQVANKDDLDWFFLLAMAHARTEIVRFEEVWWRLRLVDARLTRRADDLRPSGMLERLWLLGVLGRTLFPRPYRGDRARFLEFFHANLRDYLLQLMGQGGGDVILPRGRCETPPAWRALDRLSSAAREWEQAQQLLLKEDVACLMEQREVAIERVQRAGEPERPPFYLLFLRDADRVREPLCRAACECLAYSALVHDEFGRWAMGHLFRDAAQMASCCRRWLARCALENRAPILRYLVESKAPDALELLRAAVLEEPVAARLPEELWRDVAAVLHHPLYAARYRADLVAEVLGGAVAALPGRNPGPAALPDRVREFVAATCNADPHELASLLAHCASRFQGSPDPALQDFAPRLAASPVAEWLAGVAAEAPLYSAVDPRETARRSRHALEIRAGAGLLGSVDDARCEAWRGSVEASLGIPIPDVAHGEGELEDQELEIRLYGRSVSIGRFFPGLLQILKRDWDRGHTSLPGQARITQDDALQEVVLWVEPGQLREIGWQHRAMDFDEAVCAWLEQALRVHVDRFFGFDLLARFLGGIETLAESARLFRGVSLQTLRQVVVNLVHERVPLASHGDELVEQLQQLVTEVTDVEVLTQKLRESVKYPLCRTFCDDTGQLSALTLEQSYEDWLTGQVEPHDTGRSLRIEPAHALALASGIRARVELHLARDLRPVLLCTPALRLPLVRMLRAFDPRMTVLSFTELPADLPVTSVGLVPDPTAPAVAAEVVGD